MYIYYCRLCWCIKAVIVHPESFRSNAQNAIAFARRNRPRVNRSDRLRAFICVCLCLRAFASTVCDQVRAIARTYVRSYLRACEVHLIKEHQIKLRAYAHVYTRTYVHIHIYTENARARDKIYNNYYTSVSVVIGSRINVSRL